LGFLYSAFHFIAGGEGEDGRPTGCLMWPIIGGIIAIPIALLIMIVGGPFFHLHP
jgi:hypothetical protein